MRIFARSDQRIYSVEDVVIDAGNTGVKIGVYSRDRLCRVLRADYETLPEVLAGYCAGHPVRYCLVSSVGPEVAWNRLVRCKKLLKLSLSLSLGIANVASLSDEVGADRLALVAGTALAYPGCSALLIDAGTCVTYDFVDARGVYACGNISPGLQLRLNAMHQFTSNLPQLAFAAPQGDTTLERRTTATCMRGGAIDGLAGEVLFVIDQYRQAYGDFKIVLTGGDAPYLAERLKNTIFAQPNYLLDAMYVILKHNV